MNDRIDLQSLAEGTREEREHRITARVMREIRTRTPHRGISLADEILAAGRPAILIAGVVALLAWAGGREVRPPAAPSSMAPASALGLPDATSRLAQSGGAPTLGEMLAVFGQAP